MNKTLVLMAAGFGTRFGGGVKQIEPVGPNGEVLMDYAVYDAMRAGFDRVVFILRKDIEDEFRAGIGGRTEKKCDVEYVFQELSDLPKGFSVPASRQKPWGTAQAVLACRKVLNAPFCVLNADDFYGPAAYRQVFDYIYSPERGSGGMDICMAGYVLGNTLSMSGTVTRGLCSVNDAGILTGITETGGIYLDGDQPCAGKGEALRKLDPASIVSMNIWGFPTAFIPYLEENFVRFLENLTPEQEAKAEYLLPVLVGDMLGRGEGTVRVLPTNDKWFGMTYAADKLLTQKMVRELVEKGQYPAKL